MANLNEVVERVQKLVALAGNNPNEAEKVSAALKACDLIREHGLLGMESTRRRPEPPLDVVKQSKKEFYRKIAALNGSPKGIAITRLQRCSSCGGTLRIGDLAQWIPKTQYVFHAYCWAEMKISYAPR